MMRIAWIASLVLMMAPWAYAADTQPSLDELLGLTPAKPTGDEPTESSTNPDDASEHESNVDAPAKPAGPTDDGQRLSPEVIRLVTGEGAGEPSGELIAEMDQVARRLSELLDASVATQRVQQSVLTRLDQLIAEAKRQQQSQQSSSSSSSGQSKQTSPQQQDQGQQANEAQQQGDSSQAASQASQQASMQPGQQDAGPATATDTAGSQDGSFESAGVEWGNLPPRLRDQLQQGMNEQFSSIYKYLTEAYYRRLAEESN